MTESKKTKDLNAELPPSETESLMQFPMEFPIKIMGIATEEDLNKLKNLVPDTGIGVIDGLIDSYNTQHEEAQSTYNISNKDMGKIGNLLFNNRKMVIPKNTKKELYFDLLFSAAPFRA